MIELSDVVHDTAVLAFAVVGVVLLGAAVAAPEWHRPPAPPTRQPAKYYKSMGGVRRR